MPEHLIEVYLPKDGNILAGERFVSIGMPTDSTVEQMEAATHGAKSAATQMLARFGTEAELEVIYIKDAPTSEELDVMERGIADGSVPIRSASEVFAEENRSR